MRKCAFAKQIYWNYSKHCWNITFLPITMSIQGIRRKLVKLSILNGSTLKLMINHQTKYVLSTLYSVYLHQYLFISQICLQNADQHLSLYKLYMKARHYTTHNRKRFSLIPQFHSILFEETHTHCIDTQTLSHVHTRRVLKFKHLSGRLNTS